MDEFTAVDVRALWRAGAIAVGAAQLVIGPLAVPLSWTRPNYGGYRAWFVCSCGRRAAILYVAYGDLACRRCLGLAYSSQRDGREGVLWRRYVKARDLLAARGGIPNRPKGMHVRTHVKMGQAVLRAYEAWLDSLPV